MRHLSSVYCLLAPTRCEGFDPTPSRTGARPETRLLGSRRANGLLRRKGPSAPTARPARRERPEAREETGPAASTPRADPSGRAPSPRPSASTSKKGERVCQRLARLIPVWEKRDVLKEDRDKGDARSARAPRSGEAEGPTRRFRLKGPRPPTLASAGKIRVGRVARSGTLFSRHRHQGNARATSARDDRGTA